MHKSLAICVVVLVGWLGLAMASNAFPVIECALNADASAITVVASYPKDNFPQLDVHRGALSCQQACLVKAADAAKFSAFQCQFRLNPDAPEQVVCEQKGGGPGAYVDFRNKESVCVPIR